MCGTGLTLFSPRDQICSCSAFSRCAGTHRAAPLPWEEKSHPGTPHPSPSLHRDEGEKSVLILELPRVTISGCRNSSSCCKFSAFFILALTKRVLFEKKLIRGRVPAGHSVDPGSAGLLGRRGPRSKQPFMVTFFRASPSPSRVTRAAKPPRRRQPKKSNDLPHPNKLPGIFGKLFFGFLLGFFCCFFFFLRRDPYGKREALLSAP